VSDYDVGTGITEMTASALPAFRSPTWTHGDCGCNPSNTIHSERPETLQHRAVTMHT